MARAANSGPDAAPTSPQQSAGCATCAVLNNCQCRNTAYVYSVLRYRSPFKSHQVCSTGPLARSSGPHAPRMAAESPSPMQMVSVLIWCFSKLLETVATCARGSRDAALANEEEASRQKPAASPGGNPDRFAADISCLFSSSHSNVSPWMYESTPPTRQIGISPDRMRACLLYTSDAADERSSVDLGGRRII